MMRPALLFFMLEGPAHGYELMARLEAFGLEGIDPSQIYRALRDLEAEGAVQSTWDEEKTQGPPRRVYTLTGMGFEILQRHVNELRGMRDRISRLLDAYDTWQASGG